MQFYSRILTPTEIQTLAAQPPQPGIAAHLVTPGQSFSSAPFGPYAFVSTSLYVDVAKTDWLALNSYPQLRAAFDTMPGKLLGPTGIDDYISLTIINPLGHQMTVLMDQNGSLGEPFGPQAMILGTAGQDPTVVRWDNFGTPSFFNESGAFNSLFTVSGTYTFSFVFDNIGGPGSYPDIYLLTHTVPEPSSIGLVACGLSAAGVFLFAFGRKSRPERIKCATQRKQERRD